MEITAKENCFSNPKSKYITEEDIKIIVFKHKATNGNNFIENYTIRNASDKMLGFLCDYWQLQVHLGPHRKTLQYFLKVISVTNAAKAEMVQELKLFEKELYFYSVIKQTIMNPDLRPWSAGFITDIKGRAIVFEDMSAQQYKLRDKFMRFDMAHTFEALNTLARFHASSILYEEKKSKKLGRVYSVNEDFHEQLNEAGYQDTDNWFIQCSDAALKAIKQFSNYTPKQKEIIESQWFSIWSSSLDLANASTEFRNVICHRDLWNNNLMFHYKEMGKDMIPDDCILVDFQAARYQPPAGDVMLLLYCNLDPKFREEHLEKFLSFYFEEINRILYANEIKSGLMDRKTFFESAETQRLWAAVVCACLLPQFWINDDLTTKIFCDTEQFDNILSKNKSAFVINMMQSDQDYKEKVLNIFEEIVERYCL